MAYLCASTKASRGNSLGLIRATVMKNKVDKQKELQKKYYDQIEFEEYEKSRKVKRNQMRKLDAQLEISKLSPESSILDVGCGTGIQLRWLLEKGYRPSGIDLSSGLIEKLRERLNKEGIGDKIELKQSDAEDIQYPDNTFDQVMGTAILHHVPNPGKVVKEMARVVKPGGWVTVAEPNIINPWILINVFRYWKIDKGALKSTVKNVKKWFKDAGLKDITYKRVVFVPPIPWKPLINLTAKLEPFLEKTPVLRTMGGIIVMGGRK